MEILPSVVGFVKENESEENRMAESIMRSIIREAVRGIRFGIYTFTMFGKVFTAERVQGNLYAIFTEISNAETCVAHVEV